MTEISVQKVKSVTYLGVRQGCWKATKMTPFCHKIRHTKTINLTQKYFVSC